MRKLFRWMKTTVVFSMAIVLQPVWADAEPELKLIEVNGFQMQYIEQGSGPLLILLHGFTSDLRTWKQVLPKLAENYRVIAPSQRYFGKVDWNENWPTFNRDLLADDVAGLINALDDGPAHLVGWSMGGAVSHIAALRYPDLVRSAYLFEGAATLSVDAETAKEDSAFFMKTWGPVIKILQESGPQGAIGPFVNTVSGNPDAWDTMPEDRKTMYQDNARIFAFVGPKYEHTKVDCETLKASKVNTLHVYGTASIEQFQRELKRLQNCVGPEPFEIVEGATHSWPRNDVESFVESVTAFVTKIP